MRWAKSHWDTDTQNPQELPDDIFDQYPFEIVARGVSRYRATSVIPSVEDVVKTDPEWERAVLALNSMVEGYRPKQ